MHGIIPRQSYRLLPVPPDKVRTVWTQACRYLREGHEATGRQFHEIATLLDISARNLVLWIVVSGERDIVMAMTTKLYRGTEGLMCYITCLGGRDMRSWFYLKPEIEAYAKAEKCVSLRIEGRPGWQRMLSSDYAPIGVILEKRL